MSNRVVYEIVLMRSGGNCEAIVDISAPSNGALVQTRCGKAPIEIHHRLTRARGGEILDDAGETYHLAALCRAHHSEAHDQSSAFDNGLLIAGSVLEGPVYTGPDRYLSTNYPPRRKHEG